MIKRLYDNVVKQILKCERRRISMNIVKTMHREISLRLLLVTRHYLRIYWLKYLHITPPVDIEISLKTHHIPRAFFFFLVLSGYLEMD